MREINVKYELMRATADHLATEVERLRSERDAYNERCDELRRDAVAKDAEIAALTKALDRATSNKYAVQNDDMKTYTVHEERDYSRLTPDDIALCERLEREVWSKKS